MAVSIIWSLTNGGESISDLIDHGNLSNGSQSGGQTIYIRHDGTNKITNVGLYMRAYSGVYGGSFTATGDLNELISWGNGVAANTFGGFLINMDAIGGFPSTSWPIYTDKSIDLGGGVIGGFVHCTGQGDSEGNAVELSARSGATIDGEIQAGSSPNVRIQVAVAIPILEDTVGIRQWDQVLRYNYTS